MAEYKLEDIVSKTRSDPLHLVRGHAIQSYAALEGSLRFLLGTIGEMKPSVATVIFFKITDPRARDGILEKLIKQRFGTQYVTFWNSYAKRLGTLSHIRNAIVHWNAAFCVDDNGHEVRLIPPVAMYDAGPDTPTMRTPDLVDFIKECDFLGRLGIMFNTFLDKEMSAHWTAEQLQTWTDIFQQPLVYPPPSTHPLFQTATAPESQPQSSPASQPHQT
jgi:hypothetical protein